MSILGDIVSAIFGGGTAAAQPTSPAAGSGSSGTASSTGTGAATGGKPGVDVAASLDKLQKASGQKLNWRKSIVDLMKLLKLDSSVKARKALADELKYPGDKNDSAAMNIWLHKQVMTKLAENGGVVPKELQD
jgi:hypothetical protein